MYTSHGHHIPGTPLDPPAKSVARCGGPRICRKCSAEVDLESIKRVATSTTPKEPPGDPIGNGLRAAHRHIGHNNWVSVAKTAGIPTNVIENTCWSVDCKRVVSIANPNRIRKEE